jgi:hypothetical protein
MNKFGNSEFAKKPVNYYNLDVIISVGYRVKSYKGTQFRIWANKILKDYLTKGYAIDQKRFQEQSRQLEELKQTVKLLGNVVESKALNSDEATGLLKVVTDYAYALDVLDKYDPFWTAGTHFPLAVITRTASSRRPPFLGPLTAWMSVTVLSGWTTKSTMTVPEMPFSTAS